MIASVTWLNYNKFEKIRNNLQMLLFNNRVGGANEFNYNKSCQTEQRAPLLSVLDSNIKAMPSLSMQEEYRLVKNV